MSQALTVYNSLSRQKEVFESVLPSHVGMYVCGPTVYSDVHLGNCRSFVSFDIIFRYLRYLGYKVRYVRNITDVGHLQGDTDIGAEDKIAKKARLEKLEPMEVAQRYERGFHQMMQIFNTLPPSIEPKATGHIIEQIEMIQAILENGYAYEVNGSVYFDTPKFIEEKPETYGKLSGRIVEDLLSETRDLKNQDEKRHPSDFAIWIKADPSHIMRWNSPWSEGFPGWHLECSAMSTKYLGRQFDIHGGGSDLKFPHHENEVAQNVAACNCQPAKYWLHGNMLLMNGRKMSKSDGNTITPTQLFTGDSPHVSKGYSPMVVRFFMLQAHYRSTLDISDIALQGAEKGYYRLMSTIQKLEKLQAKGTKIGEWDEAILDGLNTVFENLNDDFNTPKALASVFELVNKINALGVNDQHNGEARSITKQTLEKLKTDLRAVIFDIFGLLDETQSQGQGGQSEALDGVMKLLIELRQAARANKDWGTADKIRDDLQALQIELKDGKMGSTWQLKA